MDDFEWDGGNLAFPAQKVEIALEVVARTQCFIYKRLVDFVPCSFKSNPRCTSMGEIYLLLFVFDHNNGICFLVDSGAQISLIIVTKTDKLKGPHKLTLQAINKSRIQTWPEVPYLKFKVKMGFHPFLCYSGRRESQYGVFQSAGAVE